MSRDHVVKLPDGMFAPFAVGDYFVNENGNWFEFVDWPTDGPEFRRLDTHCGYDAMQYEEMDFRRSVRKGNLRMMNPNPKMHVRLKDGYVMISFVAVGEDEDIDTTYMFDYGCGEAWPEHWTQGGETYRAGLEDVPDFIIEVVEHYLDVEVVER